MDALTIFFRLVIAAIFLSGSLGKLSDIAATRQAIQAFGISPKFTKPLGLLLPVAELLAGAGLVFTATAWWSAVAASFLLTSFAIAIGVNLLMGRTPDCNCFGRVHSAPIGKGTLALNLFLLTGAVFLISRGDLLLSVDFAKIIAAITAEELVVAAAFALIGVFLTLATWFLLELYRQNGRLLERIEKLEQRVGLGRSALAAENSVQSAKLGLTPGSLAPAFDLEMLDAGRTTLTALIGRGKPLLLAFIEPTCGPCAVMLPTFSKWHSEYASVFSTVIISRGSREANRQKLAHHQIGTFLLQMDREVANAYRCFGTPGALFIDSRGRIASYVAQGAREIEALVERSHQAPVVAPSSLKQGDLVPALVLDEVSGKKINLSDFRGRRLALLFWNPACGFCSQMLKELILWERTDTNGRPGVLLVSRGSAEENRRLGLRSPIVLDDSFTVGKVFGVGGTPAAVLVDETGLLVSYSPAMGADQVFRLLGHEPPGTVRPPIAAVAT